METLSVSAAGVEVPGQVTRRGCGTSLAGQSRGCAPGSVQALAGNLLLVMQKRRESRFLRGPHGPSSVEMNERATVCVPYLKHRSQVPFLSHPITGETIEGSGDFWPLSGVFNTSGKSLLCLKLWLYIPLQSRVCPA